VPPRGNREHGWKKESSTTNSYIYAFTRKNCSPRKSFGEAKGWTGGGICHPVPPSQHHVQKTNGPPLFGPELGGTEILEKKKAVCRPLKRTPQKDRQKGSLKKGNEAHAAGKFLGGSQNKKKGPPTGRKKKTIEKEAAKSGPKWGMTIGGKKIRGVQKKERGKGGRRII